MKENYFKSVVMIERLHRLFLEVMKAELDRMKIRDINNVQCLVLYKVGMQQVIIGDLKNYDYYLGSNVSYNLRKMIQNGYVVQQKRSCDGRSSVVKLSPKGIKLHEKLEELFGIHADIYTRSLSASFSNAESIHDMDTLNKLLINFESFLKSLQGKLT